MTEPSSPALRPPIRTHRALLWLYIFSLAAGGILILRGTGQESDSRLFGRPRESSTVVVLPINGVIGASEGGPGGVSSERLVKRLKSLRDRKEVKAVVLRVNSPGGSVGAVQEIHEEILRLKQAGKKIVVSMGEVAASGGYYVACPADAIYANPGTLTGSIGVILQIGNAQELLKKIGLKMEAVKSASHKDIGSPFRPVTEEERAILQSVIREAYDQFVDAVAQGRRWNRQKALSVADGRIFSGSQAKKLGLVDDFGNLESAVAKAAELAGISGKPNVSYDEDSWGRLLSLLSRSFHPAMVDEVFSRWGARFAYLWEFSS